MSSSPQKTFQDLEHLSKEIHTYGAILSLLHWDKETYMPPAGIVARSQQMSLLSSWIHELKTGKRYKSLLGKLVSLSSGKPKVKGLSRLQQIKLREWRREFFRSHKLPTSFVKTFAQATAEASQIWANAKRENNFKLFAPFLGKIVELSRKKADILQRGDHPYDALLEAYEPCMTTHRLGIIFEGLKKELKSLLKKIESAPPIDDSFLHREVDREKQLALGNLLLSKLPMEPDQTRLDISAHPFSIALHPHDSRITTRILPSSFLSNLFSILHEAGHSFYEMGLHVKHWGTPLAEAVSLSIHESQSRWWETLIGKSPPFWKYFYPLLQKELPSLLKAVPLNSFYRAMHRVAPTCIRVEADEVTYCLHVILRFEIEKQLISGELSVSELPEAWNAQMKELLGITPPTESEGCLQDIHWSLGDFGYFPTYALGNLLAAQFFTAFTKKHPDWENRIAEGEFTFIREWLIQNIHCWGKTYNAEELVKKVTQHPLSETAYCSYLKKKYATIYAHESLNRSTTPEESFRLDRRKTI